MTTRVCSLLVIAWLGAVHGGAPSIGEENGLRVEVSTARNAYWVGQVIEVRIRWSNLTDGSLSFPTNDPRLNEAWIGNPNGNVTHFAIEVLNENNDKLRYDGVWPGGGDSKWELGPHEVREVSIPLSDFSGLSVPGRYRIRVAFLGYNDGGAPGDAWRGIIRYVEAAIEVRP